MRFTRGFITNPKAEELRRTTRFLTLLGWALIYLSVTARSQTEEKAASVVHTAAVLVRNHQSYFE